MSAGTKTIDEKLNAIEYANNWFRKYPFSILEQTQRIHNCAW